LCNPGMARSSDSRRMCSVCRIRAELAAARAAQVRQYRETHNHGASDVFAGETDRMRGTLLGPTSEADHATPLKVRAVAAYERFLSVGGLHVGAVGTLIDQYELVATDLDAGVRQRDPFAHHHDVQVLAAAN